MCGLLTALHVVVSIKRFVAKAPEVVVRQKDGVAGFIASYPTLTSYVAASEQFS